MIKILKLNSRPCEVEFTLRCKDNPIEVMIAGFDYSIKRICYFNRVNPMEPGQTKRMSMNVPFAPRKLSLYVYDMSDDRVSGKPSSFDIYDINIKKMKMNKLDDTKLDEKSKNIIRYLLRFCRSNRRGTHKYKNTLVIDCLKHIKDDFTSARISVEDENPLYLQIDKSIFDDYSFPGRVMTCLHEVSHKLWNQDEYNEIQADNNAANIMLYLGFPPLEILYCFEILFYNDDYFERRRDALLAFIKEEIKNYPQYYDQDAKQ